MEAAIDSHASLKRFGRDFVAGGFAAIVSKTIIAPVERVKLLLQLQAISPQIASTNQYKGVMDCFIRIHAEQGVASYWRGNLTNILRHFPMQATSFALNDAYRRVFFGNVQKETQYTRWVVGNLLCGGVAGATTLTATYPLDYARTRLAADVGRLRTDREFDGMFNCLRKTFDADGVRGLFRGYVASVHCVFLYRAAYFGLFETLRTELFTDRSHVPSSTQRFLATWGLAQSVTIAASFVSYPFDTVRRRLMMQSARSSGNRLYVSTYDCWKATFVKEGLAGFYKGFAANLLRSTGSALILAIYEEVQHHYVV